MTPGRPIRILIVDDSAVMRSLLRSVIATDSKLEVAATAADGASALSSIEMHLPDLVLLDVEMPVKDGLVTLRQLRQRGHKMPVIMCSSLTHRGAKVTIEALACGASDYVAKPAGQANREEALKTLAQDLLPKIHALAGRTRTLSTQLFAPASRWFPFRPQHRPRKLITSKPAVIAIGVSTGGPAALDLLLPALPRPFRCPFSSCSTCPRFLPACSPSASTTIARCMCAKLPRASRSSPASSPSLAATGTWKSSLLFATARRTLCTSIRIRLKIIAARPSTSSSAPSPAFTAQASSPWSSPEWAPMASPVAASFARREAPCWRRIRPAAPSGACPALLRKPDSRIASSRSAPSLRRSSVSPAPQLQPRRHKPATLRGWWSSHGNLFGDYNYLRDLVFSLSQNVLDPSRDYLFDTRLSKVLRNQGMNSIDELVGRLRTCRNDPRSSAPSPRP